MRSERSRNGSIRALVVVLLLLLAEALVSHLIPVPARQSRSTDVSDAGELFAVRQNSFLMTRPLALAPNE
jgi:hypothetical protein